MSGHSYNQARLWFHVQRHIAHILIVMLLLQASCHAGMHTYRDPSQIKLHENSTSLYQMQFMVFIMSSL